MNVLLTGGAGYIGSHTYLALMEAGHIPYILDNFSTSHSNVISRLERLTKSPVNLFRTDVRDTYQINALIKQHKIQAAVHFAAFKAVSESHEKPLLYYNNNVGGLISLLEAIADTDCLNFVYSSSATVYGETHASPLKEDTPLCYTNPYGHTKIIGEEIILSVKKAYPKFNFSILRYFNPVGAHSSGVIGEAPTGVPNNLLPYICSVAAGKLPYLKIFGSDYPTSDGTGVRDYIHVMDLAEGHVQALNYLNKNRTSTIANLGTGQGTSVLEMLKAFERNSGVKIPYVIDERRKGDVSSCYADASTAEKLFAWKASRNIDDICADAWQWQLNNPNGYT